MKNRIGDKTATGLKEREDMTLIETVEGTSQCMACQRFMRLGDGRFCLTFDNDNLVIAEIVGWVSGECDRFMKAERLF